MSIDELEKIDYRAVPSDGNYIYILYGSKIVKYKIYAVEKQMHRSGSEWAKIIVLNDEFDIIRLHLDDCYILKEGGEKFDWWEYRNELKNQGVTVYNNAHDYKYYVTKPKKIQMYNYVEEMSLSEQRNFNEKMSRRTSDGRDQWDVLYGR
jgi:hypothetical protein